MLQEAVQHCRGCDLYQDAMQAAFGELETRATAKRPKVATLMIGEQPGDEEDKQAFRLSICRSAWYRSCRGIDV